MKIGPLLCLLLYNCLREVNSCACERNYNKTNVIGYRKLPLSKRQLGYGMDGDTSEIFGTAMDEVPEITPTPLIKQKTRLSSRPPVARIVTNSSSTPRANGTVYTICSCTKKNANEKEILRKLIRKYGIKILPSTSLRNLSDDLSNRHTTKRIQKAKALHNSISSTTETTLNDAPIELKEHEFETNVGIKDACPFYKHVPELEIEQMVDVWQLYYYKTKEILTCFKIYIWKTNHNGRMNYKQKFSTFNGTIDWEQCYLELNSVGIPQEDRKHFLQGSKNNNGVLENIVLSEHTENGTKTIILQEHTPDQWMVTKNLLLMRDCDNGEVIIFNRLESQISTKELVEAMNEFGKNGLSGTKRCLPPQKKESKIDGIRKYEILS